MIEQYLKAINMKNNSYDKELTPIVKSLKGTFRRPENINYKKELSKIFDEKYLSNPYY